MKTQQKIIIFWIFANFSKLFAIYAFVYFISQVFRAFLTNQTT